MTLLEETIAQLSKAGAEVKRAIELAEETKSSLTLLNKSALRKMGLTTADIRQLPEVHCEERMHALYQAADVQEYLDSRKIRPVRRR